jgi:putative endonuclease
MNHFTYILQSEKDHSYYIGSTSDPGRRVRDHNEGRSPYTSKKRPWRLVYFEEFDSRKEAFKREIFLKKQKNKEFYRELIKNENTA